MVANFIKGLLSSHNQIKVILLMQNEKDSLTCIQVQRILYIYGTRNESRFFFGVKLNTKFV